MTILWYGHAAVPGLPIIGNLHQLKEKKPHQTFARWSEEYGPIYSIRTGASSVVVVNSAEVAKEVNLKLCFFAIYNSVTDMFVICNYTVGFIHFGGSVAQDIFSVVTVANPKFCQFALLVISLPAVHFLCFLKVEMYQGLKRPPFCFEKMPYYCQIPLNVKLILTYTVLAGIQYTNLLGLVS